jgi:hypothetical protein
MNIIKIFLEIIYPYSLVCWEPYLHVGIQSFIFEAQQRTNLPTSPSNLSNI